MTRILTDGAEMGDILLFSGGTPTCIHNVGAVVAPSGYYCYSFQYLANTWYNLPDLTEFYFRERVARVGSFYAPLVNFRHLVAVQSYVSVDALNRWIAVINGVTIGTGTHVMLDNLWYLVEVHMKIDGVNGKFTVLIDGNIEIDFTGNTTFGGGSAHIDNLFWSPGANCNTLVDDLGLNDTAGGVDDSWVGPGHIVKVIPNDNSAFDNNWHGSDGDDVDNYLMCDEYPNDGDVTYDYRSGADSGVQQQFKMDDSYSGVGKTITRIYAEARARKTAADAYTLKLGQLAAGGADVVSAGRPLFEIPYTRIVGDEALVNPVTGVTWVEADIDAIEFVAEVG